MPTLCQDLHPWNEAVRMIQLFSRALGLVRAAQKPLAAEPWHSQGASLPCGRGRPGGEIEIGRFPAFGTEHEDTQISVHTVSSLLRSIFQGWDWWKWPGCPQPFSSPVPLSTRMLAAWGRTHQATAWQICNKDSTPLQLLSATPFLPCHIFAV